MQSFALGRCSSSCCSVSASEGRKTSSGSNAGDGPSCSGSLGGAQTPPQIAEVLLDAMDFHVVPLVSRSIFPNAHKCCIGVSRFGKSMDDCILYIAARMLVELHVCLAEE
jgi:hypothetical protein